MKKLEKWTSKNKETEYIVKDDDTSWKLYEDELLNEHNVVYNGKSVHPLKIVYRKDNSPLFVIGVEDDSKLIFEKDATGRYINSFDCSWADSLIDTLRKAQNHIKKDL